jgi:glycosyltransferase involved in cell wall biosynthesis
LRLAYVANPYSIHTQRWMRYFIGRGHEVHLIGVSPTRKPLVPSTMPSGVVLYDLATQINVRKLRYLVWGFATRRIVHRIQPDILHAHQVAGDGWVGAATGFHPFVVTAWGSDLLVGPERSWIHRRLARWVLGQADYVTCVSKTLATAACALGARPGRTDVVHWGIDTSIFKPSPSNRTLRQQLDLSPGPVVLSIRALRPLYNSLDIARAIPRVLQKVPDAQFIVRTYSYDPDLLARFQSVAEECGAAAVIQYVGDLPDDDTIADLYRMSDVAVSVPSSDGTPLSVLEAMACGTSLVVSDLPSLREWITDGRNGLLVPVGNVEALAEAIIQLLRNSQWRAEFRRQNQRLIQERANRQTEMAKMEALYNSLSGR